MPTPRARARAQEQRNAVARFLEGRGLAAEALEVATDPDYRFELAVGLGELGTALALAAQAGTEAKWRQLGELALSAGKLQARPRSSPVPHQPHCNPLALSAGKLQARSPVEPCPSPAYLQRCRAGRAGAVRGRAAGAPRPAACRVQGWTRIEWPGSER